MSLSVTEPARSGVGVFGSDADDGEGLVDEGVGAVLHLAGGVAFGVNVGDFFELECTFEGDGVVDAVAEEEKVVGGVEFGGDLRIITLFPSSRAREETDWRRVGDSNPR